MRLLSSRAACPGWWCGERGGHARSRSSRCPTRRGRPSRIFARGRFGRRAPRRRPSGAPPPLPRHLRTTGAGWLIAAVVAIVVTALVFRNGVSGAAITVIVVDDTVVRWMSDIDLPGIHGIARGVSYAASWWVIEITVWLLIVALIVFRRWRHLVIYLVVSQVAQLVHDLLYDLTTQPRPFGVPLRGSWGGWSLPSIHMLALAGLSVIALYTLVPEGRLRNRLKWVVAVVVTLVALARLHLGVDSRERHRGRRPHRRQPRGDRLPLLRAERGLPGDVPPGAGRAPRRRRRAR